MTSILSLEIISIVSLVFGILSIFLNFSSMNYLLLTYLWIVLLSLGTGFLIDKDSKNKLLLIFGLLPLVFNRSRTAFSFLFLLLIIIFIYFQYGINKGSYEELIKRFKSIFLSLGALALFALMFTGLRERIGSSILFFIIYILSSIIQIRSMRHLESGMDIAKLRKINTRYIILITIFSIIAAVDSIRNILFITLGTIYQGIMSIFMLLIYYPVTLMLRLIDFIFGNFFSNQTENLDLDSSIDEDRMSFVYEQGEAPELLVSIVSFVVSGLVILLIIYIVYRIMKGLGNRVYNTIDYSEQKEYIKPRKKKKTFFKEKYPKESREQIRYYYRRYLEKTVKNKIEIRKDDTSLDINNKSKKIFNGTDDIRKIYIEARYTDEEPEKEKVEEIKNAYKNL